MVQWSEISTLSAALRDLLTAMEVEQSRIFVDHDTVQQWENGVLGILMEQGLLKNAPSASSLECKGCEEHCFTEVVVRTGSGDSRAHIVCEVPERQAEMGLVRIPIARLQRWYSSPAILARFVAGALGLDTEGVTSKNTSFYLGMLRGPHGRRGANFVTDTFSLEVNQHTIPLGELLFVENGKVVLDRLRIHSVLDLKVKPTDKPYQPNTDKRASRKQATAAMRQDWQDAYEKLHCEHPDKSKKWCSIRIARLPIAQGRDAETIRRQL